MQSAESKMTTDSEKINNQEGTSEGQNQSLGLSRRSLLKGAGIVGAAAVGSTAASTVMAQDSSSLMSASKPIAAREALEVLTAIEASTLEAFCDCLIPSDENGPGAKEARAVHYIDRSLASHNSSSRHNYMVGLSALNDYCNKTRNKQFSQLSKDLQNSILQAVQANKIEGFAPSAAGFFNMVRGHTIDGTFCDPYYGGNQNFVGWDMVRYPGIRLGASETDVAQGAQLRPNHQSAYDHSTYTKIASNIDTKIGTTGGGDHA